MRVLVTRPETQGIELCALIEKMGAMPSIIPLLIFI